MLFGLVLRHSSVPDIASVAHSHLRTAVPQLVRAYIGKDFCYLLMKLVNIFYKTVLKLLFWRKQDLLFENAHFKSEKLHCSKRLPV